MNPPLIIIMAAGLGKRMNSDLPKVLHCINGVPIIVKIIREALLLSPIRILIVVGKYHDVIESTIQEFLPGNKYIDYVVQDPALGTGHAIKCCIPRIMFYQDFYINFDVLVLSGDVPLIKSNTMRKMLVDLGKVRVMTTTLENAGGYGRVIQNAKGEFQKIVEDKDCSDEERLCQKVNAGIYAFDSYTLCDYLPRITNTNAQNEYYLTDIVELIHQKEDVQLFDIPSVQQHEILGVNIPAQLEHLSSLM
jgi:UDP-N-acetylglucosamine diphosphorylase/glucosamine-1-phosphate N-acetyltransferase